MSESASSSQSLSSLASSASSSDVRARNKLSLSTLLSSIVVLLRFSDGLCPPLNSVSPPGSYKIPRNRKDPPTLPDHVDEFEKSPLIEESVKKDFALALTNTIGTECLMDVQQDFDISNLEAIGSWACFMKKITSAVQISAS